MNPNPNVKVVFDKQKVISDVTGKPKLSLKILIVFGILFLIIIATVLAVSLFSKVNQNKQITLTWWGVDEDSASVTPLINEYEQSHPNVKIQFVSQSTTDYGERLMDGLGKSGSPDVFEFQNSWVPMVGGRLLVNSTDFSSQFYPVVANDLKTQTGFLGVPLEVDDLALFVNQDIFNAYGKSAPKTWDDFVSDAQLMTLRDANGNIKQSGAAMGVTSNISYWQNIFALLALQNGVDLTEPSSVAGQSTMTFYTNFSNNYHVWDETLPVSTTAFVDGQLAMYFGQYSDVFSIQKQNPNLHFEVVPVPQIPANGQSNSVAYASYWVEGVNKSSSNGAAAWDFLKFMTSQSSLRELYKNEQQNRGYGNIYPRPDMQSELLTDPFASAFIYQATFAKSWYLDDMTFDGATGINSQVAKPFSDAIEAASGNITSDLSSLQSSLTQVLASYGLVAAPSSTP